MPDFPRYYITHSDVALDSLTHLSHYKRTWQYKAEKRVRRLKWAAPEKTEQVTFSGWLSSDGNSPG